MTRSVITNSQVKKIHTLVSVLKWKDEWYRDNLYSHFRVDSSIYLNYAQAEEYIGILKRQALDAGVWKTPKDYYKDLSDREDMATPGQIRMLKAMWKDISDAATAKEREKGFRGMLLRIVKVEDIRFLERKDVRKMVNCFTAMRKQKETSIKKSA